MSAESTESSLLEASPPKTRSYPITLISRPPTEKEAQAIEKAPDIRLSPYSHHRLVSPSTLQDIKPLIGSKKGLSEDLQMTSSILLSWTIATPEQKEAHLAKIPSPVAFLDFLLAGETSDPADLTYVSLTVTNYELFKLYEKVSPAPADSSLTSSKGQPALGVLESSIVEILHSMLRRAHINEEKKGTGKTVKIPLCEIRERDIVVYRYLRQNLDRQGMGEIGVRADNVLEPNRKEAVPGKIYAFCAGCFKLSTGHLRCTGCKVCISIFLSVCKTRNGDQCACVRFSC